MIVKPICRFREAIVASPELLARLGKPNMIEDLVKYFPISNLVNLDTGRLWGWHTGEGQMVIPKQPHFVSNDIYAEIQAALAGRVVSQLVDYLIELYLKNGRLVRLFPQLSMPEWALYLYRPYQTVTSARVKWVFDTLGEILCRRYAVG